MPSILQGRNRPPQREMKPAPMPAANPHLPSPTGNAPGEAISKLISNGDGTHAIEHEDGSQTQHPHIGHALMTLAGKHSDGMHHHVHHDGMGGKFTAHTSEHGGDAEGPHEHDNVESVKSGLANFFNENTGSDQGASPSADRGKDYD